MTVLQPAPSSLHFSPLYIIKGRSHYVRSRADVRCRTTARVKLWRRSHYARHRMSPFWRHVTLEIESCSISAAASLPYGAMEPHVVNNNNNGSAVLPFDLYGLSNDLQCTCGHIFIVFKIKRDTGRKTPIIHTRLPFDSYGLSESLIFYPPKILKNALHRIRHRT